MVSDIDEKEDEFLLKVMDFSYGQISFDEIRELSLGVSWAKGWPQDKISFWNVESYLWQRKISHEKRLLIENELQKCLKGIESTENRKSSLRKLDIGCGAYSYANFEVGLDMSPWMLKFNDRVLEKVEGDLEKSWVFEKSEFGFVFACFILNYIRDLDFVLGEVVRVLNTSRDINGEMFVVLSAIGVSKLAKEHEKQNYDFLGWKNKFLEYFRKVNSYEKEDLWFFVCKK